MYIVKPLRRLRTYRLQLVETFTTPPASSSKIIQEPQQSQQAMLYIYLIPYIDIYRSYILLYICIFATILLTIWPGLEGISTCIDS